MELAQLTPEIAGKAVATPVLAADGKLLLAAGEVLTVRQIARLTERGITHLYVRDPFLPELPADEGDLDPRTREVAERALSDALSRLAGGQEFDVRRLAAVVRELKAEIDRSSGVRFSLRRLRVADSATLTHSVNVAVLALVTAQTLGLGDEQQMTCALGGLLHDTGKALVPRGILLKPGPLNPAEWQVMREHPQLGHAALMIVGGVDPDAAGAALGHHERLDGSGYPSGLQGLEIGLVTRVVTVADIWDALISARVYKPSWTPADAAAHLREESGARLDASVVRALISRVAVFPNGAYVRMADGAIGWVVGQSASEGGRPSVVVVADRKGAPVTPFLAKRDGPGAEVAEGLSALPPAVAAYLNAHRAETLRALAQLELAARRDARAAD